MTKAIIVEDEPTAQEVLTSLINTYTRSKIEIVSLCSTIEQATETLLNDETIQLVFLDIQLGEGRSGFELFQILDFKKHAVIFTTAFEKHAIQALKLNAVDFLLKPINYLDLIVSVNKAIENLEAKQSSKHLEFLYQELKNFHTDLKFNKLVVSKNDSYEFIHFSMIEHLQGDGNYTRIFCRDGKEFLTPKTLKTYEEILPKELFFRVHKSYLVNLNQIKSYSRNNGNFITLLNNIEIPVAQRKTEEFMRLLNDVNIRNSIS